MRFEVPPNFLRPVPYRVDEDVRVEHVAQHQNSARSCCDGWSLSAMKSSLTPPSSNHSAQLCALGVMTQDRPRLTMSTLVTPSGRRTDFGKRTACVLFVMKTDPRPIGPTSLTNSLVYTFSTHVVHRQAAHLGAGLSDHTILCGPPTPLCAANA